MTDAASISQWVSIRLATGSALFITYFFYFLAYWFSNFKQLQNPMRYLHMEQLGSKMYLYGIGVLLSINFLQTCIFTTLFTYFNMVAIFAVIAVNYIGVSQPVRSKVIVAFYFLLFFWYVAIMSDLYITNKN